MILAYEWRRSWKLTCSMPAFVRARRQANFTPSTVISSGKYSSHGRNAALSPYQQELPSVVVESTYNWYWLVDGLMAAGHSLYLASTTAIKQYDSLKQRADESDARHLAHVLWLGLLPEGHIMSKADRVFRDLAHRRMRLVGQRTSQIVSIETSMAGHLHKQRPTLPALVNQRASLR